MKDIIVELSKVSGAYGVGSKLLLDNYNEEKALKIIKEVHSQVLDTRNGALRLFGPDIVSKVEVFIKEREQE